MCFADPHLDGLLYIFMYNISLAETVEKSTFPKMKLFRGLAFFFGYAYGQQAYQVISIGYTKYICKLVADAVGIGDVTLVPAACIAHSCRGKEHILYSCGIVLHRKAAVTVSYYVPAEDEYHCGRCFGNVGVNDRVELFQQFGVVGSNKADSLFVAARGCRKSCFEYGVQVITGDRHGFESAAVAAP